MTVEIKNCPIVLPLNRLQARTKLTQFIAVHCSATKANQNIGVIEINDMHKQRGFACIGYHYVIKRDGTIERGRPVNTVGAHVEGYNSLSVGICIVGGLNAIGKGENNFTPAQFESLRTLVDELKKMYKVAKVQGHRDFSKDLNFDGKITSNEWMKECPCFDVQEFFAAK
jgi:N-acetylmuramoyl-L-alanine amidase